MIQDDIKNALEVLRNGGVILYPTDTIWGLGCDANNEEAIEKIYKIKQRIDNHQMIVLTESSARLAGYVEQVPDVAYDLIDVSDKPLTIVYTGAKNLAKNILGEDNSIGIRITKEKFSQSLLNAFRKPIVSTSANIHGKPSPAHFGEIAQEIISSVDYVVKYRQDERVASTPSSIIKLWPDGTIKILRS